jgi:hypothetical protein
MLKRFMPRARGGSSQIQKKMSHVIISLSENPNQKPGRFTIKPEKKAKKERSAPKKKRPRRKSRIKRRKAKSKKGIFSRGFSRKTEGGE